jgi:hypothetical protein
MRLKKQQSAPTELGYFLYYSFYKQKAPTERIKYENATVVQNSIHFLKSDIPAGRDFTSFNFVETMIINKAKPHRGELFVEMIQPMKLSSVGATCGIENNIFVFYVKIFSMINYINSFAFNS